MTSGADVIEMTGFDIRPNPGAVNAAINSYPPTIEVRIFQANWRYESFYQSAYGVA